MVSAFASGRKGTEDAERNTGSKQVGLWAREAGVRVVTPLGPPSEHARAMPAGPRACPSPASESQARVSWQQASVSQAGGIGGRGWPFMCEGHWLGLETTMPPTCGWVTTGLQRGPGCGCCGVWLRTQLTLRVGLKGDRSRSRELPSLGYQRDVEKTRPTHMCQAGPGGPYTVIGVHGNWIRRDG